MARPKTYCNDACRDQFAADLKSGAVEFPYFYMGDPNAPRLERKNLVSWRDWHAQNHLCPACGTPLEAHTVIKPSRKKAEQPVADGPKRKRGRPSKAEVEARTKAAQAPERPKRKRGRPSNAEIAARATAAAEAAEAVTEQPQFTPAQVEAIRDLPANETFTVIPATEDQAQAEADVAQAVQDPFADVNEQATEAQAEVESEKPVEAVAEEAPAKKASAKKAATKTAAKKPVKPAAKKTTAKKATAKKTTAKKATAKKAASKKVEKEEVGAA